MNDPYEVYKNNKPIVAASFIATAFMGAGWFAAAVLVFSWLLR